MRRAKWLTLLFVWAWPLAATAQAPLQLRTSIIEGSSMPIVMQFWEHRCAGGSQANLLCRSDRDCPLSTCAQLPVTPATLTYRLDATSTSKPLLAPVTIAPTSDGVTVTVPPTALKVLGGNKTAAATLTLAWTNTAGDVSRQDAVIEIRRTQFPVTLPTPGP